MLNSVDNSWERPKVFELESEVKGYRDSYTLISSEVREHCPPTRQLYGNGINARSRHFI